MKRVLLIIFVMMLLHQLLFAQEEDSPYYDFIAQGEGLVFEFKKSYNTLPRNVFESICALLNRQGGHILLGVTDDGNIEGIKESSVQEQN